MDDAIVAVATAPGRGGIGVVRVSGRGLEWLIEPILGRTLQPRHAHYGPFLDADDRALDRGIALYFPAPHSYTGEDVLELQGHGGPVVLQLIVERCLAIARERGQRLRLAEGGEFTRRAFLNDKLDLAQAEAVADLIEAQTEAAARSATASLEGAFSREIHELVEQVTHLRLLVEATLDFPEEEIDFLERADALGRLERIEAQLARVMAAAHHGALLREGLTVVLAGLPNAGKSSLLNALAGEEVAIVTPIAGTTRDRIRQSINLDGIPLVIVDTAGLRDTSDEVERVGIARTWDEVARAEVVLHLHDLANPDDVGNQRIAEQLAQRAPRVPVLRVFNKADTAPKPEQCAEHDIVLSAKTHAGLNTLRDALRKIAGVQHAPTASRFIARTRHVDALRAAQVHLQAAREHARVADVVSDAHLDLFAEELRLAQERLSDITGEFTADDLLGAIFSRFCIGK
ncbi:MAG TPA: tRNA uridine-5-carboxymethylaminomethyl(34) synthesis GTPase MnmE [Burkholderiaceae bacterium]|nr:tRNA uridine-5-carboxymethylaminomethyl(34) synthesis GTPase MnmE [Burkholderiaceae bacterium]